MGIFDSILNNFSKSASEMPPRICKACDNEIPYEEYLANDCICPHCGTYLRMRAYERLAMIADGGSFQEIDKKLKTKDPLKFPDYAQKIDKAEKASGLNEGVITGTAKIEGESCGLFIMDSAFMMGSMGTAVGEKITRLFEKATAQKLPVIGFTTSGGARMQEGIYSLMQMAKVSGAVQRHGDAGLLYIAVLTDPTTGGITASFAMQGDIIIAEPKALVGFAGQRVIEQTTGQKLPAGFQRSEFLLEHGFVDIIEERGRLRYTLAKLLAMHSKSAG